MPWRRLAPQLSVLTEVKLRRTPQFFRMRLKRLLFNEMSEMSFQPTYSYCSQTFKILKDQRLALQYHFKTKSIVGNRWNNRSIVEFVCGTHSFYTNCNYQPTVPSKLYIRLYSTKNNDEKENKIKNTDHTDPWIKSLLADIKKDFETENQNSVQHDSKLNRTEMKDGDYNFTLKNVPASHNPTEGEYEYDYRYADIEEFGYYDQSEINDEVRQEKQLPILLNRGASGVFELEELMTLMEHLGADNIVSFPVPPEANYCDHMVVVTAKSKRHMQAINDEMLWVHKRKKWKNDPVLRIEGLKISDWCAMDLGNLVLHIFLNEEIRQYYDIESLWTLGPENDPKCLEENQSSFALSAEDLFWLEAARAKEQTEQQSDS